MVRLLSNEVRVVDTPGGPVRIRLQLDSGGEVGIRAQPNRGERDELQALAAIAIIHEHAEAQCLRLRALTRRHRPNGCGTFVDVTDALILPNCEQTQQLLMTLPQLLNRTIE